MKQQQPPHDQPAYIPTPSDIRRECERIQKSWSRRERAKRSGIARRILNLPMYDERVLLALPENAFR